MFGAGPKKAGRRSKKASPRMKLVPGNRVAVKFDDDWYPGTVEKLFRGNRVKVHFDDGTHSTHDFDGIKELPHQADKSKQASSVRYDYPASRTWEERQISAALFEVILSEMAIRGFGMEAPLPAKTTFRKGPIRALWNNAEWLEKTFHKPKGWLTAKRRASIVGYMIMYSDKLKKSLRAFGKSEL